MNALIYDLEIIKAVPDRKKPLIEGIEYCKGFEDHASMGISAIGAYDYKEDRYRVFLKDNFDEFRTLAMARRPLVSFNGIGFDNNVLRAGSIVEIPPDACYDILVEMWIADGLGPKFVYPSHIGYGLSDTCFANFALSKTSDGAIAPIDWQRGNYGTVIDYCINDIKLTKRCFDRIRGTGGLRSPKDMARFLEMRKP